MVTSQLKSGLIRMVDIVYPPRCPICGKPTDTLPVCSGCIGPARACLRHPPRLPEKDYSFLYLEGAASVYRYEGMVASAIRSMKYSYSPWRAHGFGKVMAEQLFGYTFSKECGILKQSVVPERGLGYSCIVPVPSTRRGDEHIPGMLAAGISRYTGIPVLEALSKSTPTPRQEEMETHQDRMMNLWGSFSVRRGVDVEGKRILLVDDVITTGTTVSACAQTLVKAGADSVFAVSIAAAGKRPAKKE